MDPSLTFTILTAIKDGVSDFRKTVPTVLSQTLREFEWIIVDDASTPPLAVQLPELALDSRVRILRLDQGQGQTRALNLGIHEARGSWIVRMDGDDLCSRDRLEKISSALAEHSSAELLFSDYSVIDGRDRAWAEVRMRQPLKPGFFTYLEKFNNPICHPSVAFRRRKASGELRLFRQDLVNAQDYALWKEIFAENGPPSFVHLPFPTVSYRIVRNSLSGARAREQATEKRAIRAGLVLREGEQTRPLLSEPEKNAMQAYRLLYYRFIGHAAHAALREDLALLRETLPVPAVFGKALFYLTLRPLRGALLKFLFSAIYE